MAPLLEAYRGLGEFYASSDPGVCAIVAAPDDKDPELIHDLQVFADDAGFVSHANDSLPEVAKGFGGLFSNYNMTIMPPLVGVSMNKAGL